MPSLICANLKVFTSHTLLVFYQDKISTLQLHRTREVNERLCIGEVGVDFELCVHAHRHDEDLLIEASFKINYSLDISSSCIWDSAFCNRGSGHVLLFNTVSWTS